MVRKGIVYRGLLAIAAGALALALLAVGCGSSASGSLGKADFIEQGNAICEKAENKKSAALQAALAEQGKSKQPLDKAAEERLVATIALPPIDEMTEELADLGPPEGEATVIVSEFETAVAKVKDNPDVALTGDPFGDANKLAKEYGFKACALI